MADLIPLDYTKTFSDLLSVYEASIPPTDVGGLPPIIPDTVFPLEIVGEGGYTDGTYNVRAYDLKEWLLAGVGQIKHWTADTLYYPARVDVSGNIVYPPDVVWFNDALYLVLSEFQSGAGFEERVGGTVVLDRLTKDSDLQYNEITAAAFEPFDVGQVLGQYTAVRSVSILKEYPFPNSNIATPQQWHVALCNASIDSPVVVDIKRRNYTAGVTTIGTITFTPNIDDPHQTLGVLAFNDSNSGAQDTTRLYMEAGDSLFFTLNTTSPTLEWLSVNFIGQFVNYTSPYFNIGD